TATASEAAESTAVGASTATALGAEVTGVRLGTPAATATRTRTRARVAPPRLSDDPRRPRQVKKGQASESDGFPHIAALRMGQLKQEGGQLKDVIKLIDVDKGRVMTTFDR